MPDTAYGILYTMSLLSPVAPQQIGSQVYDALERAIVECRLEPGTPLTDRQLAHDLGVSRTPVRDALRQLEATGLVERRGRVGWAVAGVDVRDIEELFELRCLLEPAGLASIVQWEKDRLTSFTKMFDGFSKRMVGAEIERYLNVDDQFHQAIVSASGNRRLVHGYRLISRQLDRFRHFTSYRADGRVARSLDEHRQICSALARRDAEAAAEALVAHINSAKEKLIATVKESAGPAATTPRL